MTEEVKYKFDYNIDTLFLNPRQDPMNVRGTETSSQRDRRAHSVENGIAAELSSTHRIRFMMKNRIKTTLLKKQ